MLSTGWFGPCSLLSNGKSNAYPPLYENHPKIPKFGENNIQCGSDNGDICKMQNRMSFPKMRKHNTRCCSNKGVALADGQMGWVFPLFMSSGPIGQGSV